MRMFQSLTGRLQTSGFSIVGKPLPTCFNPSQVGYKQGLGACLTSLSSSFQSLTGRLQTSSPQLLMRSWGRFQSLTGRLQTRMRSVNRNGRTKFQSLTGRLQTSAPGELYFPLFEFQSLTGRLQTYFGSSKQVEVICFNPSQVGYKPFTNG